MKDDRIDRMREFHLERAEHLERYANHWWRISKYAWLHAAAVHRHAADELARIQSWRPPYDGGQTCAWCCRPSTVCIVDDPCNGRKRFEDSIEFHRYSQ